MKTIVIASWVALAFIVYFIAQDIGIGHQEDIDITSEVVSADQPVKVKKDDGTVSYLLPRDRLEGDALKAGNKDLMQRQMNLSGVEMSTPIINTIGGYLIKTEPDEALLDNSPVKETFDSNVEPLINMPGTNDTGRNLGMPHTRIPDKLVDLSYPPLFQPNNDLTLNNSANFSHVSKRKAKTGGFAVVANDTSMSHMAMAK